VTAATPQLRQALGNTAVLAAVLANRKGDLVRLLDEGGVSVGQLGQLVATERPNLACLLHDLAAVNSNLAASPNLGNLSTSLAINQLFFGSVRSLSVTGPATALTSGDHARGNQLWLRVRLFIPPMQPAAVAYSAPNTLPPVLPGAGCSTEFGQGVGPGLQPGFAPAGPSAHVDPPTASEAKVRGRGAPIAAQDAVARLSGLSATPSPGPSLPLGAALLGLLCVAWALAPAGRRSGRARRHA
jgi:hypothetical protein